MECWNKCSRLSRWRRNHEISLLSMIVINRGYEGGVRDSAYRMRQRGERDRKRMRQLQGSQVQRARIPGYAIRRGEMIRCFCVCGLFWPANLGRCSAYAEEIRPIVSAEAGKGKGRGGRSRRRRRRKAQNTLLERFFAVRGETKITLARSPHLVLTSAAVS